MGSETIADTIRVFGSSMVRVAPDTVTITIAVARLDKEAKTAFSLARGAAGKVMDYLAKQKVDEFGSSRVKLSQETEFRNGLRLAIGYRASIGYTVVLKDLDRTEDLLTGMIAAGANDLTSVVFQTSRLREIRADARRQAVRAAVEKAELYCKEAGVALGKVVAIEDSNPDQLSGRGEGHMLTGGAAAASDSAIDPAMIAVGAAVQMIFAIVSQETTV